MITMSLNGIFCRITGLCGILKFARSEKNGEIPPGKLRQCVPIDLIRNDIFVMCDKKRGYLFAVLEKLIWDNFLSRLFLRKLKFLPSILGTLSTFLVIKYGLGLQNLVK